MLQGSVCINLGGHARLAPAAEAATEAATEAVAQAAALPAALQQEAFSGSRSLAGDFASVCFS